MEVLVKDIVGNITTLTNNGGKFKLIKDYIDKLGNEEIILDFKRIELVESYSSSEFLGILSDQRVKIKIYNKIELKRTLDLSLELSGIESEGKVINIVITLPDTVSRSDLEVGRFVGLIRKAVVEYDDRVELQVSKVMANINRENVLEAIKRVALEVRGLNPKMILNLTGVTITDSILDSISDMCLSLIHDGVNISVETSQITAMNKINTFLSMGNKKRMDTQDKIDYLDNNVSKLTAGVLSTFVRGKKKDVFGRSGNGEIAKALPAIYKYHDGSYVYFDTFKVRTFMTKKEYSNKHDGDILRGLDKTEVKIPIKELGLFSVCIGSNYHFNYPVQYEAEGIRTVPVIYNEQLEYRKVSIGQHMKLVFDEFGVEYDLSSILKAIRASQINLKQIGIYIR